MSTQAVEVEAGNHLPRERKRKKRKHAELGGQLELVGSTSPKKIRTDGSSDLLDGDTAVERSRHSPFVRQRWSLYVPLSPIGQSTPLPSACAEYLSPLILNYHPPFKGVVVSYSNPQLSASLDAVDKAAQTDGVVLGRSIDEYAVNYVWLTADFAVFKPQHGQEIEGWVNLQTETHIGLVCWNYFTASIEKKRLPRNWKWAGRALIGDSKSKGKGKLKVTDEEEVPTDDKIPDSLDEDLGHYEDDSGNKVDGLIKFRVVNVEPPTDLEHGKGILGISGTLLSAKDEETVRAREVALARDRSFASAYLLRDDVVMSGAA